MVSNCLAHCHLEVAVALALELPFNFRIGLSGNAGINAHQVVDAVLALAVNDFHLRVGDSALKLFDDAVLGVEQEDGGFDVFVRFGHLLGRVCQ